MAKKPPSKRMRGYDYGGQVLSTNSLGNSISSGFKSGTDLAKAYNEAEDASKKANKDKPPDKNSNTSNPTLPTASNDYIRGVTGGVPVMAGGGNARGGKIKQVAGKPIGKDDGLIPAQRGEWVIRKSAVKKLGNAAMSQINKGKIPPRKGR